MLEIDEILDNYLDNKGRSTEIATFGLNERVLRQYYEILGTFEDYEKYADLAENRDIEQNFLFCVIYNYIKNGISQTDAQYSAGQLTGLITELSKKYKSLGYAEEKTRKILNVVKDYVPFSKEEKD